MRTTGPWRLRLGLGVVVTLAACGDRSGPLNEYGVRRYGASAVDETPVTAAVGAVSAPVAPAAPAAPAAPPPPTTTTTAASAPTRVEGPAGAYRVVPVAKGGTVRVRCKLAAAVTLPRVPVFKDHEKGCGHAHDMTSERLVFDEKSLGVGNCLVRLLGVAAGKDWPEAMRADDRSADLDQKGCVYLPHLLVVRPNTQVRVKNSDAADHNIHAYRNTMAETAFNVSSAPGSLLDGADTYLERVGVYIVKCDIHPWMSGHVVVVTDPYFDVTRALDDPGTGKAAGEAVLTDVPPGEYEIEMWHEGTVETVNGVVSVTYSPPFVERRPVTVPAGGEAAVEIVFTPR